MSDPSGGDGADPPSDGSGSRTPDPSDSSETRDSGDGRGGSSPPSESSNAPDSPVRGEAADHESDTTDHGSGGADHESNGVDHGAGGADDESDGVDHGAGDPTTGPETPASVAEKAGIDEDVIGTDRSLDPRIRYRWIAGACVGSAILAVFVAGGVYVLGGALPFPRDFGVAAGAGVGVFLSALLFGTLRALLLYRSWSYVVREDSLFLSRGVFTRVRTVVPYVRVQHIDTQRGPLERMLGLSTLVVYTAGSRGADVTVPGLAPQRATNLQERLKRLAIESEEEDAV